MADSIRALNKFVFGREEVPKDDYKITKVTNFASGAPAFEVVGARSNVYGTKTTVRVRVAGNDDLGATICELLLHTLAYRRYSTRRADFEFSIAEPDWVRNSRANLECCLSEAGVTNMNPNRICRLYREYFN